MEIVLNFSKQCLILEKQNEKLSVSKMKPAISLYESTINLCFESLVDISSADFGKDLNEQKIASYMILLRILQTVQSMKHLVMKGYYFQSSILLRSFYEGLGLCIHLSKNSNDAEKYLDGKKLNITSVYLFKCVPKFLYNEKHSSILKIYGILCDHVHTNYISLFESYFFPDTSDVISIDGKERIRARVNIPSEFDKDKVMELPFFPLLLLSALKKIFSEELSVKINKLDQQYREFIIKYYGILGEKV